MKPVITDPSRYEFCETQVDSDGRLFLDARKPYRFRVFDDTIIHIVQQGDTLFTLAGRYYRAIERPAGLWWVIADFQPIPIHDPTVQLAPGQVVMVPTLRRVITEIFSESRRQESRL